MRSYTTYSLQLNDSTDNVSCSSTDTVQETRSRLQTITTEALKMNARSAVGMASLSDGGLGKVMPPFDFLSKCKIVSDRLGFVVRAVDTLAEVYPFPSNMPRLIHCSVGSPIRQDGLECDLIYSNGRVPF